MVDYLKNLFRKMGNQEETKKDGIENLGSDVDYSCRNGFEYHELKYMYGCYNDYRRQYEYRSGATRGSRLKNQISSFLIFRFADNRHY